MDGEAACGGPRPARREAGGIGATVWVKVAVAAPGGPPPPLVSPADPCELTFLLLSTRIPARRD